MRSGKLFFSTFESSETNSVSFVIGGVWLVQYSPVDLHHDLVQPPALCGEGGAAPWGPRKYSSLGSGHTCEQLLCESPIAFRCWGGAACRPQTLTASQVKTSSLTPFHCWSLFMVLKFSLFFNFLHCVMYLFQVHYP